MYITHNNQVYPSVRVLSGSGSVRFVGESLSGVTELTGLIMVYADNNFELQSFTPGDFLRQEAAYQHAAADPATGRRDACDLRSERIYGVCGQAAHEREKARDSRRDY